MSLAEFEIKGTGRVLENALDRFRKFPSLEHADELREAIIVYETAAPESNRGITSQSREDILTLSKLRLDYYYAATVLCDN